MKVSLFDRMAAKVAPQWASERLLAQARINVLDSLQPGALMPDERNSPGDTLGGTGGSARRWWRGPRSAKGDTLPYLRNARAQSRDLARSVPIAVGAINTNVDRVVGTGLALSAQPNRFVLGWTEEQALDWKRNVQNEFSLWADSHESDLCQTLNFYQQQALVLRGTLESGDLFTILPDGTRTKSQPYALRIQLLEADRVGDPIGTLAADSSRTAGGIRINANGAPVEYFVYKHHPGEYVSGVDAFAGEWYARLGASGRRRMLHHYRKLRPEQPRGMPYLTPIIDGIKQLARYTEAEIMAAVISSYFTVFVTTPSGSSAPVFDGQPAAASSVAGQTVGLEAGMAVGLQPGETITTADPSRPNPNFEPFILAVIKQMGMALGIPYELLIKQFNASYSASKAALLDAWVYFRGVRTWMALSFCQPVYETWLAEAVAIGRVSAPGFFSDPLLRWAYSRALWPGDSMGSINPKDEVAAYTAAIDARIMSRERAEWEMFGTDFNDTFDTKVSEHKRLKAADMLPVPKAGAAAPVNTGDDQSDPKEITK